MIFEDSCYIILHRDRSSLKDRTRNLLFVIKYIRSELDIPILVVEQDIKSNNKLYEILRENNVKYEFLYNPGLFNRSWGYNCAINIIKQNRLILADNDVILSNCKLIDCLMYLNYYDIVKPYNIMYDLPNTETTEIIEKNILPTVLNTYKQRIGMTIFSAMIAIKKNAFLQMGGYDERFEGWGGEDDEMTIHLWKYINNNQLTYYQLKENLIHLYHDRTIFDGNTQPNYKNNYSYIYDNNRNSNIEIGSLNKYENQ